MTLPTGQSIAALVVAGGRGLRVGGDIPKQYRLLGGRSIIERSLLPFFDHPQIRCVQVVINAQDRDLYARSVDRHAKLLSPVEGGATRQQSVQRGLEALRDQKPDKVLIHDAARPFVTGAVIDNVVDALADGPAALAAIPLADTLKKGSDAGTVETTVPRDDLYLAQTPQGFHYDAILAAHADAAQQDGAFTDDASIAEFAGLAVKLVPGDPANSKITTEEDLWMAERLLATGLETRVGTGYDVHALGPGSSVILGGIAIPATAALVGHSDADVALHALTDAILGTIGDGDIGAHFPPSDPAWKGASSDRFLADAMARLRARGGVVTHLDLSVIAEEPKIGPHREAMRARIAEICEIETGRVSVKATTNERLGFVGRGEGIAAIATATVKLPIEES